MQLTTQALILSIGLTSFVFLLAIGGLLYFYSKLGYGYLRLGAWALVFALGSVTFAGMVQYTNFDWVIMASLVANLLFSIWMYAVLAQLRERSVSLALIGGTMVATLALIAAVLISKVPFGGYWTLIDVPGFLLLSIAAFQLLGEKRYPGHVALVVMLSLHVLCRGVMPLIATGESGYTTAVFFSGISILFSCGLLTVICAEQLIQSLKDQEERLYHFEQENRRLELQFTQAQKHESLGVLAGGIAHDFNNMLTSVLGYTSLAMRKLPADSDVRKDLYMVMSGARQAVELTSQMLVYAGKGAIEFESVDISRVVDNMAGLINSIVPRKIHLQNKTSRDLPLMRGDAVQLGQVVMNLVANAVDAIESKVGSIELQTGLAEVDDSILRESWFAADHEPGAFVYLKVSDTGVGMDAAQIGKIFDPFYTEKREGKGLGLSSISGIVRQHKGFVRVESTRGEGSAFTVYFPVLAYHDIRRPLSSPSAATPHLKGRVLLADDDPRIRSLIASILESDGFAIVMAEDGREAAKRVESAGDSFDIFVLDCTMPKMSGTEVYRQIRSSNLSAPVLLISGYRQEQVISDISHDDHAYFIKKPFSVDELIEMANGSIRTFRSRDHHTQ